MTDGTKANSTGNTLEQTVKSTFSSKGFEVISYKEWEKKPEKFGKRLLLTNAPYTSIYGHNGKTEFLLIDQDTNIRIECKWQQVAGSVDEKLPYLYLNCIETMPENDIIVLIDGNGWKKGAINWLKEAVDQRKYTNSKMKNKNIKVFSLTEFITWANNNF